MTGHWAGYAGLGIFVLAYLLVVFEEKTHMAKSKPVVLAAGLIWALIGVSMPETAHERAMEVIADYGELLLFLLVAITYVNTLEERRAFEVLRAALVRAGLGYRALYWLTGGLAFCLSGVLDNLTTALVMGAVVMALGRDVPRFAVPACVSLVVAANAGGAFTPFGDITTLMVWQKGKLGFFDFFALFLPALVNWLIPAVLMSFGLPGGRPVASEAQVVAKPGMWGVVALFAATIVTAVIFKNALHLPPAMGMMLGLGYLQVLAYALQRRGARADDGDMVLDSFAQVQRVEWDTLLFFFGIIFAVGGLGVMGWLGLLSAGLYDGVGATTANVVLGLASAVVDNIPLMFAVLTMDPALSHGQWLLITLTCGVGGSILSVGSAAGVALMGLAKGTYTFGAHLRWAWAVALGYGASVIVHIWWNAALFG
ncbi:sodium:proton antiporter NhaD [Stagnihabitans tardus]|uniref:Sodium:proton antiporter n=1 Tax=Stagnihabitans tardus TaxID=2699202 RepID=A0AAE5BUP3_9RHOB|nr:sodium:proton antiporter NhaD [Stagnihabitans tardus]NBZ88116.1 sodium:proton antiporter [Stagnihabitans tardus]